MLIIVRLTVLLLGVLIAVPGAFAATRTRGLAPGRAEGNRQ